MLYQKVHNIQGFAACVCTVYSTVLEASIQCERAGGGGIQRNYTVDTGTAAVCRYE